MFPDGFRDVRVAVVVYTLCTVFVVPPFLYILSCTEHRQALHILLQCVLRFVCVDDERIVELSRGIGWLVGWWLILQRKGCEKIGGR